ncbi:MAG: hypothetical protein SNJ82_11170 [Gemmataceae bacterium]
MVSIRGFLVLAGVVARTSGRVAETRLGTQLAVLVAPTLYADHPADDPQATIPPSGGGVRAGRSCGAVSTSRLGGLAEQRGQQRGCSGCYGRFGLG